MDRRLFLTKLTLILSATLILLGWGAIGKLGAQIKNNPPAVSINSPVLDYPKTGDSIRYVVPFSAGGLTDVLARQLGQGLSTRWNGVTVVVDNRPGSNGQIGASVVAKSPGNGLNLLGVTLAHSANVTLFSGKSDYDFQRELRPVALLAGAPMLIVVRADSDITDLKSLIRIAQTRPLNAGSSGAGTPPHLLLELFNEHNKTKIAHIPYKGGAPSMTDLIGGQLDIIFSNMPESIPHVKSGKLRALAIASEVRHPLLPDVPTVIEAGMPQIAMENWTGVMVPATTPDVIVNKLGAEIISIMKTPELAERAKTQGFRIDPRGPDEFAKFLKSEIERWARIIARANIVPE